MAFNGCNMVWSGKKFRVARAAADVSMPQLRDKLVDLSDRTGKWEVPSLSWLYATLNRDDSKGPPHTNPKLLWGISNILGISEMDCYYRVRKQKAPSS